MSWEIRHGDALSLLRGMESGSVDAVVTDPPYGLEFMGKGWDYGVPGEDYWREALRVMKPGAHLLAFGGTRTFHRLTCAIEDAGFEVRDCLSWLYGSGFPKSLDVSKAIDKRRHDNPAWIAVGAWLRAARNAAGLSAKALCGVIGAHGEANHGGAVSNWENGFSCPTWKQWLAMKAVIGFNDEMDSEVWRLNGRKGRPGEAWHDREVIGQQETTMLEVAPGEGRSRPRTALDVTAPATDAARQWQGWGTALKPAWEPIILARKPLTGTVAANVQAHGTGALNVDGCRLVSGERPLREHTGRNGAIYGAGLEGSRAVGVTSAGRWPANLVLDEDAAQMLDEQSGEHRSPSPYVRARGSNAQGVYQPIRSRDGEINASYGDAGGASRFFYTAKASAGERHYAGKNTHPTVKPVDLMRWLCRLVTPPGGLVLDPFCGSGSTGVAALAEGFRFIGFDREAEYVDMARKRIAGPLFAEAVV